MDKQQNSEEEKKVHEDSADEFQEFKEQFMTYSMSSQLATDNKNIPNSSNKTPINPKSEKPKLKIIHEEKQKLNQNMFLNANKKIRKGNAYNSRVISIGNAIFRSDFESGNIFHVEKTTPNTYEIYLNKEVNSDRVSAWFYFKCQGLKGQTKFIIKGFRKSTSLYNQGMKVCYRQNGENPVWRRGGTKIAYTDSYIDDEQSRNQYELRFSYFFKTSQSNSVEFAYCFPYTYTHLVNFLSSSRPLLNFSSLGKSYEGRQIPLVTIGNQNSKHVVVLSARAHPGETVGSHMMEGFIRQLLSNSEYGCNLREAFLFKIVPMINVDGVVQGNYRFSGSGFDLNRKWKKCRQKLHPEVYLLKKFIRDLNQEKEVIMYIDLHGHSRQKNVFFYGCCPKGSTDSEGKCNTKPKQFPFLMSKLHNAFRYDYCSYAVQKDKQGTARITMWNQLKINFVYTLQASFCGSQGSQNYLIADYQKFGSKLCQGICINFISLIKQNLKEGKHQENISSSSKIDEELKKTMTEFHENPALAEIQFEGNSSDSEPEAGQIPEEQRKSGKTSSKNVVSIQKFYKTSKMLKFNDKLTSQDDQSKQVQERKHKRQEQDSEKRQSNFSINLGKASFNQMKKSENKLEKRRQIKTSNAKSYNSYSIRAQMLNKTINQKINQLQKNHTETNSSFIGKRQNTEKYESQELFPSERTQAMMISKKKAISFEGAQYRRVRKIAEEHNRRNFSMHQANSVPEDDTLIKGLIGMNNLIQIDQMKVKQKTPSFFPNTVSNQKNRKHSIQMHFRRQIKANDYTARRLQINGIDHEVKCYGKQIL